MIVLDRCPWYQWDEETIYQLYNDIFIFFHVFHWSDLVWSLLVFIPRPEFAGNMGPRWQLGRGTLAFSPLHGKPERHPVFPFAFSFLLFLLSLGRNAQSVSSFRKGSYCWVVDKSGMIPSLMCLLCSQQNHCPLHGEVCPPAQTASPDKAVLAQAISTAPASCLLSVQAAAAFTRAPWPAVGGSACKTAWEFGGQIILNYFSIRHSSLLLKRNKTAALAAFFLKNRISSFLLENSSVISNGWI